MTRRNIAGAGAGDHDAAFANLLKAKRLKEFRPAWTWKDPDLEPLHTAPRFVEIVGQRPVT
jgi:hypothetical protein